MRHLLAFALCGQVFLATGLSAQSAQGLNEVHRIYLSFPANKPALKTVAMELARALERSGAMKVVSSAADADAVLTADGDVYVKEYVSLNPRAGRSTANGEALRGGFLSVELKGKGNDTLWSYLATPKTRSARIEEQLSRQVTRELVNAIRSGKP